jgi:tetratricopeptide (TPR) repeat protein
MAASRALLFLIIFLPSQASQWPNALNATGTADIHRTHGRYEEAVAEYRKALALFPGHAGAHRGLGQVLDLSGRHAEARTEFTAALPGARSIEEDFIVADIAASFAFERRFDDAHATLQKLADQSIAKHGHPGQAYAMQFDLALATGKLDEAERLARQHHAAERKLHESSPDDLTWLDLAAADEHLAGRLAVVAARRGRSREAAAHLAGIEAAMAPLLSKLPAGQRSWRDVPAYQFPAGETAFWLGDVSRAIKFLTALEPYESLRARLILAQAYERAQDLATARKYYRRIVESHNHGFDLALARPVAESRLSAIGK